MKVIASVAAGLSALATIEISTGAIVSTFVFTLWSIDLIVNEDN
jgi:hypothetical protein